MFETLKRLGLKPPTSDANAEQKDMADLVHNRIEEVYKEAWQKGRRARGHGLDHNIRVAGMSIILACNEDLDPFYFRLQAVVHDLGRVGEDPAGRNQNRFHGQLSVEMLQDLFDELGLLPQLRQDLEYAIGVHPFRNEEVTPTPFVQILQDADRLDQLSGYGPLRSGGIYGDLPVIAPQTGSGTAEADIATIRQDLDRVLEWESWLHTETARKIAAESLPILKALRNDADMRSQLVYATYQQLGVKIDLSFMTP